MLLKNPKSSKYRLNRNIDSTGQSSIFGPFLGVKAAIIVNWIQGSGSNQLIFKSIDSLNYGTCHTQLKARWLSLTLSIRPARYLRVLRLRSPFGLSRSDCDDSKTVLHPNCFSEVVPQVSSSVIKSLWHQRNVTVTPSGFCTTITNANLTIRAYLGL